MSLIDEALKRARLEAAQRAAQSEGLPYPTIPRHLAPAHRRRRWLAPAAVALAVIAGLVVGLLVASRAGSGPERLATAGGGAEPVASGPATPAEVERDPPADTPDPAAPEGQAASGPPASGPAPIEPAPPAAPPATPPAARPVTSGPSGPAELVRDPVAAPETPEAASERSVVEPGEAARRTQPRTPTVVPSTAENPPPIPSAPPPQSAPPARTGAPPAAAAEPTPAAVRPTAPPPVEAAPEPPAATTTVTDPDSGVLLVLPGRQEPEAAADDARPEPELPIESHVQRFPLPDGSAIELGGIAWSETGPFALINGRVVGPGSAIGDYTLERIQRDHVELVGGGRRVHLSLQ